MRKNKSNINVDKLTLCYNVNSTSPLQNITNNLELNLLDFKLVKIDSKHFENAYNILFLWNYDDNEDEMDWHVFGQLKFNLKIDDNKEPYIKRAWIYFENRSLYTEYYQNTNIIKLVEILENALDIELNNITNLDIAVDTTKNITRAIKHMIRNKDIDTILNSKVINDRKELQNEILYISKGNLDRYVDTSLYIRQKDKDGFCISIYNKTNEIQEKSCKNYISEWNKVSGKRTIYRAEVRLKNEHIKKYLNDKKITISYDLFNNSDFLLECFLYFSNRLLRFRDTDKIYSILEIL